MTAISNLVQQRTLSTGTGALLLSSVPGCRAFAGAFGTGGNDMFFYCIRHRSANEWEIGTGHMSDAATLVRDTVISSSAGGAKVAFSGGEKDVVNDIAAERQLVLPASPAAGDLLVFDGTRWQAAAAAMSSVSGLAAALAGKAASAHAHAQEDVAGLPAALAGKAAAAHAHATSDVTGLDAALAGKAAAGHSHDMADVTGLPAALAEKAALSHGHDSAEISGLEELLAARAPAAHEHGMEEVTGLSAALAGKAASGHSHSIADVGGLAEALDSRAPLSHTHGTSAVSGLDAALDAKVPETRSVTTGGSLSGGGDLSEDRSLSLTGDSDSPGPEKYYGTDESGAKGFHPLPEPPEPEPPPEAQDVSFDDTGLVLVRGADVQAALAAADTRLRRAGFHPGYSTHVNHFTGGDFGGFLPAASGSGANAATMETDYDINTDALGVYRMTTGTTATGAAWRSFGNGMAMLHATGKNLRLQSRIRLANLTAAGSQEIRVWGGVTVGNTATTNPASIIGMYWYYDKDNTKWVLRRRNSGLVQDVETDVTVEAGVWYDIELVITGAPVDGDITGELFINGQSRATNTQLISTLTYNPVSAAIQKTVGTTARLLYIDYEAIFMERA